MGSGFDSWSIWTIYWDQLHIDNFLLDYSIVVDCVITFTVSLVFSFIVLFISDKFVVSQSWKLLISFVARKQNKSNSI